jgi:hypothetical protein
MCNWLKRLWFNVTLPFRLIYLAILFTAGMWIIWRVTNPKYRMGATVERTFRGFARVLDAATQNPDGTGYEG